MTKPPLPWEERNEMLPHLQRRQQQGKNGGGYFCARTYCAWNPGSCHQCCVWESIKTACPRSQYRYLCCCNHGYRFVSQSCDIPPPPPSLSVPKHPNTRIIPSSAHINWLGSREQVKSQLTDEPPVCMSIAALHRDDIVASWHCFQAPCHHPVILSLGPACFYRSFNVFVFGTLTFMRFPSCRSKTKMHGTLKSAAPWFIMLSGPSPKDTEASATSSSKN